MKSPIALNIPLNSTGFGQASSCLAREFYKRSFEPDIFPIGGVDLSSFREDKDFNNWLGRCINKAPLEYSNSVPILKFWHLSGGRESFGKTQILFTCWELDTPTAYELAVARNNHKVIISSQYSVDCFETFGANNMVYVPLGFDDYSFYNTNKVYSPERITFTIGGKQEKRKHTLRTIRAWADKYGNNPLYQLNAAIFNPFLIQNQNGNIVDHNLQFINQALERKKYFNINFLPWLPSNDSYNDFLNSSNIFICCSGGESPGLPALQSLCLGKHAILLKAHSYKHDFTDKECVFVKPNGKISAVDNIFFHPNSPWNNGQIFDFHVDDFYKACDEAIARFKTNPINQAGLELKQKYTYKNTLDTILSAL